MDCKSSYIIFLYFAHMFLKYCLVVIGVAVRELEVILLITTDEQRNKQAAKEV